MKISSRLKLNALLSAVTVLAVGLVFAAGLRIQSAAREEERIAHNLVLGAYELDIFSNSYLRHPEERPREQWLIRYHYLLTTLERMPAHKPEQRVLENSIRDNLVKLKVLFDKVIVTHPHGASPELRDLLSTLMLTRSRDISLNAGRLAAASDETIDDLNRNFILGLPVFILVLLVVMVWLSIRTGRSITDPIHKLSIGTEKIGSGNLDYRIGKVSDDELGELSLSFDRMTEKLKATTVSLDRLENEIAERKQTERDLRNSEEELRKAKDELEVRVRERTEELSRALQELRAESEDRIRAVEELRQKEQLLIQQSRLAAMGEMLVNISHQWRQPLNLLGLILQEIHRNYRRGSFTGEYLEDNVAKAGQVISQMSQTIDDFRNFFVPEKIKHWFNVKEVVETTISMVGDSFREMQVEWRVSAEEGISIEGYRNEYAQVIMNILINARDVFRERRVVSPVITVKIFKENRRTIVTIADNAGGIAGDIIDKIFDPYFTTKDPDKGTGIGLFMSKTIIEKNMNGVLSVRNTDEGAEFRIQV